MAKNPLGNIQKKVVEIHGVKTTVWDVTKSYKWVDEEGNQLFDKKGRKKYKEKFKRCFSYKEAIIALQNMPVVIEEERQKEIEHKIVKNREKTFFELCDYFEKEYVKPAVFVRGKKVAGYKMNISHLKSMIAEQKEFFGNVFLSEITYEALRKFAEHLHLLQKNDGEFYKPSTINEKLSFLRRILNIAIQADWLMRNPFSRGKSLIDRTSEEPRTRILSFEEEAKLLEHAQNTYLYEYIIIGLDTGMRRGEIFNLKWSDIDLDKDVIYIRPGEDLSKSGKPGIIPITARLKTVLQNRKFSKIPFPEIDFRKTWATILKKAEITDLQFRDLRSTTASRFEEIGISETMANLILRNTPKVRQRHYVILDAENVGRIGEKLSEFVKTNEKAFN